MSPKKFHSPGVEFVGFSISLNQSLSPDNTSVQLNSFQEAVMQVGSLSYTFGASKQVSNKRHFCGSKRKTVANDGSKP